MTLAALGACLALALAVSTGAGPGDVTAPAPPATARFAVKGDWGYGTAAQAAVSRRICAEHRRAPFDALITTGDNFYAPDGTATEANFTRPERCILRLGIRYRAAWGNHDLAGDSTATALGASRRYYAFTSGPARVVVLDANAPADPAQLRFLEREMTRPATRARIVVMHQPLASAGFHTPDTEQQRLWNPLLRRGRVALVLQGHNHDYERVVRGGITHITTGGGGAPVYPCLRPVVGLRTCRPVHHFLTVTVTRTDVRVVALRPDGTSLDAVTLPVPGVR